MRVLVASLLVAGALADCSTVTCGDNLTYIFSDDDGADTPSTIQTCCKPAVESAGFKVGSSGAVAVTDASLVIGDDGVPTECATGYSANGASPIATIVRDTVTLCTDLTDNTAIAAGGTKVNTSDWTTGTWNSACKADVAPVCEQRVSGTGYQPRVCGNMEDEPDRQTLVTEEVQNSADAWVSRGTASTLADDPAYGGLFNYAGELNSSSYSNSNDGYKCLTCITGYLLDTDICSPCSVTGAATYGSNSYPNSGSNVECAVATCLAGYEKITDNDPVTCDSCGSPSGYDAARGETSVDAGDGLGGWRNAGVDCTIYCDATNFYYNDASDNLACAQCSGTTNWAPDGWSETGGTCTVTACAEDSEKTPNSDNTACEACANQTSTNGVETVADNTCAFTCSEGWEKSTDTALCTACAHGLTPASTGVASVATTAACTLTCEEGYYLNDAGDNCVVCHAAGPYSAADSLLASANARVTSVASSCQITAASGNHIEGTDGSAADEKYNDNTVVANTAATVTWNNGCEAGSDYSNKSTGDAYPTFTCCNTVSSSNSDTAYWSIKAEFAAPNTFLVTSNTDDYTLALGTVCERDVCLDTQLGGIQSNTCTSVGSARQRRNNTAQYPEFDPEAGDTDIFAADDVLTAAEEKTEYYDSLLEAIPWANAPAGVIYGGTNYKSNGLRTDGTYEKRYTDSACWGCDAEYGFSNYYASNGGCNDSNHPRWTQFTIDDVVQDAQWYGACMESDQWFQLENGFLCADDEAEHNQWDCVETSNPSGWGCSDGWNFYNAGDDVDECKHNAREGIKNWSYKYTGNREWEATANSNECPANNVASGACGTDRMESVSCVSEFSGTCEGSDTPDTCAGYGKQRCTAVSGCSWTGAVWSTDNTAGDNQTTDEWYLACSNACNAYFEGLVATASCDAQEVAKQTAASVSQSLMELATLLGSLTADGGVTVQQAVDFFNSRDGDVYNFADEGAPIQKNHGKLAVAALTLNANMEKIRGMASRTNFGFTDAVMDALEALAPLSADEASPASAVYTLLALAAAAVLAL